MKTFKLFFLLFVCITVPLSGGVFNGGNGTPGDPYQVANAQQLNSIRDSYLSAYFIQTADITFVTADFESGGDFYNAGEGWVPIGDVTTEFTGSYDGDGHTIDGLYINRGGAGYQGLFGRANGAVINNVGMINVNITANQFPGGLVGVFSNSSTMNNCYSTGSVSSTWRAGGLVGGNYSNSTITNSYSTCTVNGYGWAGGLVGTNWTGTISKSYSSGSVSSDFEYAGGLVGESLGNSTINNSYSTGSVSGVTYVGGLTGSNSSSTISNCYSTGSVTGTTSVGGMTGTASTSTVTNSFWNTETSGQSASAGGDGKTTPELKEYATFYFKDGWDFMDETLNGTGNMWGLNPAENSGYPFLSFQGFTHAPLYIVISYSISAITATTATLIGTAGDLSITQHGFCWNTSENPTVDNSKNELGAVSVTGSFSYALSGLTQATTYYVRAYAVKGGVTTYGAQLTFSTFFWLGSGTALDPFQIANKTDLKNLSENSAQWSKYFIQTSNIAFLTADFESGGDFYNGGEGWVPIGNYTTAFFTGGYDGDGHSIDSVYINLPSGESQGLFGYASGDTIKNISVTNVNISGGYDVGGLAGDFSAPVRNCYSTGSVSGIDYVGGLVGYQDGSVSNSYSTCTVTATGNYAGGFISDIYGSIDKCYSTGSVSGIDYVGGFVGYNESESSISNCYTRGDVTRSSGTNTAVGGFAGENYATFEYCCSTGKVFYTGDTDPTDKGFVGFDDGGTYTHNFYDAELSNQSSAIGATGKTTSEMKSQSTFTDAGWSASTWYMDTGVNDGYPYLSWQNLGGSPLPVELSSFTAMASSNAATLVWRTATETDNHGFEVERRTVTSDESRQEAGGQVRVTSWAKIGFVQGAGTSNAPKEYSFIDSKLSSGRYAYRLKQVDIDGAYKYSGSVEIEVSILKMFTLGQNYPNPFNPRTTIDFTLVEDSKVSLKVFDVLGKDVATLVDGELKAGIQHSVPFDASKLSSGMYFYRLDSGKNSMVKKLVLMK